MLKTTLGIAAALGALIGAGVYDNSARNYSYHADITFGGDPVIVRTSTGKLGLRHEDKVVGYFGGGKPTVIGFNCKGADMPVIAMGREYVRDCKQIAPITPY